MPVNCVAAPVNRLAATFAAAILFVCVSIVGQPRVALAQGVPMGAPTVATDPARDAAMKTFLQKHFKIASTTLIKFGPTIATPIDGLLARPISISNEQGQSVTAVVFFNKDQSKAIIGQFLDLNGEPWGRIDMSPVHLEDRPVLGAPNAPVTIVEFADFECPYCAHAFSVLEAMANTTYKGKVKIIFKNYPLNAHPWAVKAAAAAECARLQNPDAFWQFARYFYTNQGAINIKNIQEHVDKVAASQKLDAASLKACMASAQTKARIEEDHADGDAVHVNSTPTFYVDGIPVVGLPDNKVLDFVIGSELAEKSAAAKH